MTSTPLHPHEASTEAPASPTRPTLRQRFKRWAKPPRRLTLTRAGKFFMLLTLGVGAGALNTGNNLLFLLMGMMLSAIIASGLMSEAMLRKLRGQRRLPARAFAGQPALGEFTIDNPKSYLSLNVELTELNPYCEQGPLKGQSVGLKDMSWWMFWKQDVYEDERYVAIARVFEMAPRSITPVAARYVFPARGLYRLPGLRFSTRFPFGLFHKVAEREDEAHMVVFPSPLPAGEWVARVEAKFGDVRRNKAGHGEEYFGLRGWRDGEDHRSVHWKASAKKDTLLVREYEEEEQRALVLLIHPWSGSRPMVPSTLAVFERGLSMMVGLIHALSAEHYRIGLRAPGVYHPPLEGQVHMDRLVGELACLSLNAGSPVRDIWGEGGTHTDIATIGFGFEQALSQVPVKLDMSVTFEES